jgi:hypothetical protein
MILRQTIPTVPSEERFRLVGHAEVVGFYLEDWSNAGNSEGTKEFVLE